MKKTTALGFTLSLAAFNAFAGGPQDLTALANVAISALEEFPKAIGGASYLAGAVYTVKSILTLYQHANDPKSHPTSRAMVQLLAGGFLLALPSTLDIGVGSFFGNEKARSVGIGTDAG